MTLASNRESCTVVRLRPRRFRGTNTPPTAPCSRRGFLCRLLPFGTAVSLTTLWVPRAWAEGKKVAVPLEKVPQLKRVGNGVILRGVKGYEILLIRTGKKTVSAVDPTCTHKKCEVSYERKWGEIRCECHGSRYTTTGDVTEGPAKRDLRKFPSVLEKNRIVIELPRRESHAP